MSYTVTDLINNAYWDSSVVARQFQDLEGYQLSDGLQWFNELLGDKAMDSGDIPYITVQFPITFVAGQEVYFIPNCVDIEALAFYINSVRYQMQFINRTSYFGSPRANSIESLPVSYTYERTFGGVLLYVYFWPQSAYSVTLTGNFFMQTVSLGQDLQSTTGTANLGVPTITGTGVAPFTLASGQFVVNNTDLAGTYASIAAFNTAFNAASVPCSPQNAAVLGTTPTKPYLSIAYVGTSLVISNTGPKYYGNSSYINIVTNGTAPGSGNSLTFANFSTISGAPYSFPYFATSYDRFFINYLEYSLAERICQKLNFKVPNGVSEQLARYKLQISNLAEPIDTSCQVIPALGSRRALNYAQANLGRGFTVSGI